LRLNPNALSPETSVLLNIIRLFAAELVVVSHFVTTYQPMVLGSFYFGGLMGGTGIFLFFGISGFLVSYSLLQKLQNKQYSFRHYFVDRFSRIYSGLLPAMVFIAVVAGGIYFTNSVYYNYLAGLHSPPSLQSLIATLTMTMSYPSGALNATSSLLNLPSPIPSVSSFGLDSVLWSLGVEWWLYMFFGWIIIGSLGYFEQRQRLRGYKPFFIAVATVLSLVLAGLAWDYSAFILVWFLGVLVTVAISNPTVRSKLSGSLATKVLAILLFAALAAVGYEVYQIYTITHESFSLYLGLSLIACVFLGVLLVNSKNIHWLSSFLLKKRVAAYSAALAAFSYTLFLIHYPIILFLNGLNFTVDRWLLFVPILLLINQIAFILAYMGEKRHRQLAAKIKSALHFSR
jgi:peptidoglycan/LPS O-acetylase OafA/YrhL